MKKKIFSTFAIIISVIVSCMVSGCSNNTSSSAIAQIDKEETYPESPGQLEVIYSSVSEITNDATDIVKVSVLDQSVEMLDGYPQTHTTVQVQESYKGDITPGEKIEVIEEGGQDNKIMGGIPQMNESSDYVLFLIEYNEKYYVCGAFQGRFIIREGYVFQQATEDVKLASYTPAKVDDFIKTVQAFVKTKNN